MTNSAAEVREAAQLCEKGYVLLEAGRLDEARPLLMRSRELDPNNELIHFRIGLLYADSGRPGEALTSFDQSIRLEPDKARTHNNRGSALQNLGRMDEAETAFRHAHQLAPDLANPIINLGHILETSDRVNEAAALYQAAIDRGVDADTFGHHLAAISGEVTDRAPGAWVKATFDNFAPLFDAQLATLDYQVPQQLADLVAAHGSGPHDIVDLGCGTGHCGVALQSVKRTMVGVDLSEKMLALAAARKVYDQLIAADLPEWLAAAKPASCDLLIAADVFIYFGALESVFADAARVLRPGGWFAFSTEEILGGEDADDYQLLASGRYAQSHRYITELAQPAFVMVTSAEEMLRLEGDAPIMGRLYLLQRKR